MSIGTVGPGNPLSLDNIRFELSRNNTISLNDTDVRNFSTKPTPGTEISALDFQNRAGVLDLGVLPGAGGSTIYLIDAQLRALAINQGWNQINPFKLTIPSNYVLGASSYSSFSGLTISGDFAAGTVVTNYGKIVGHGGEGAGGVRGQAEGGPYWEPYATAGGTAINASGVSPGSAGNLKIVNYGTIAGGGGGGGGGDLGNFNSPINNGVGGSGGGGGAGWYVGQGGPKAWPFYDWLSPGANGTLENGGSGGGAGSQSGFGADRWGGGGGQGGALGQPGAVGQSTGWQGGSAGGKPGLAIRGIDKIVFDSFYQVIGQRGLSSNQDRANAPVSQGFLETTSASTYNSAATNYQVSDYLAAGAGQTTITDTNQYSDTNTFKNYSHPGFKNSSGVYFGYIDDDIAGPMYSDGDGVSWTWPWAFKLGERATRHRYNTSIFAYHNFWAHSNSWIALMENIEAAKFAKNDNNYTNNGTVPPIDKPHIAIGAADYVPTFMGFQAWGPAYGDIIYQRYLYKGIIYGVPFPTPSSDSQRFEYEIIFWPPTTIPNCQVFEVHVSQYGPQAGTISRIGGFSSGNAGLDLTPYVVANNTFVCVGDSNGLNWKVYNNSRIRTGRPFYT